jgi:hypothetical protein
VRERCAESAYVHGAEACDARIVLQTRKGGWARAKRTSWKGLAEQEDRKIEIVIIREGSPNAFGCPDTVAALKHGHVRVNVVPAALAEDSKVNEKIGYSNKDWQCF